MESALMPVSEPPRSDSAASAAAWVQCVPLQLVSRLRSQSPVPAKKQGKHTGRGHSPTSWMGKGKSREEQGSKTPEPSQAPASPAKLSSPSRDPPATPYTYRNSVSTNNNGGSRLVNVSSKKIKLGSMLVPVYLNIKSPNFLMNI